MKRPTIYDQAVIQAVAKKLSPKVVDWLGEEGTDVSRELAQAIDDALSYDAYRIARCLEESAHWEPDADLVGRLETAFIEADRAKRELVAEWVKSEGIQPAHQVGDSVKFKGATYEVTKVDEQMGQYLLFSEIMGHVRTGTGTHGTYANFEDVHE